MNQAKEMARIAYDALSDKKGEDIKIIDIAGVSVLADYFLIAKYFERIGDHAVNIAERVVFALTGKKE